MPEGTTHGWGIAGMNLRREFSHLPPVDGVTLHCIARHDFEPRDPADWNVVNIGYCFFEHDILAYHALPQALPKWDFIVAGSKWCEHHLRIAGMKHTTTILQGTDPSLFSCQPPRPDDGRFIVFSGGKFEFRKGHDIVIAAMGIFMERHADVWFSCAWHNQWEKSIKTMEQSRLISFTPRDMPCEELYRETLAANGIDLTRVLLHPRADNTEMAAIYAESDLGLFPNRCEGGNNMVMCEYMACGRPVVASTLTGHADVITESNAFRLSSYVPIVFNMGGIPSGVWFESSVDEVVALLEKAYRDREAVRAKGVAAAAEMRRLSWREAALRFHSIASYLAKVKRNASSLSVESLLATAERYFNAGQYTQAESVYQSLLRGNPLNPQLYNCLGTVLDCQGRLNEASVYYTKALALQPNFTVARYNLANTLKKLGNREECIAVLQQVVEADPAFADAWQNLGACLYENKEYLRAGECFERVIAIDPDRSGAHASLGEVYHQTGINLEKGITCLDVALRKQPGLVELINLKGLMHHELEQYEKAEACYRQGLAIQPRNPILLSNLGNLYLAMALPEKAIMYFNFALEIEPGNASMIFNRAMSRLMIGDYERGWDDYEYRFRKNEPVLMQHQDLPPWSGEPLEGKTLLVWAEQVYGDTIQFARYLPLMNRFGGRVVFECLDSSLAPLFAGCAGFEAMIIRGQTLPHVDYQVPLVSLPRLFRTRVDSIPFPGGYVSPDQELVRTWKEIIDGCSGRRIKAGLVWGGRKPRLNANRSMHLRQLAPLLSLDKICWFSLQTGDDREQLSTMDNDIVDLVPQIRHFGDTAAILTSLDLVITIDTATAHLAGALGVPVWVMLKSSPDWRWLLDRDDSPWYATARVFRQKSPTDWTGVINTLDRALRDLIIQKTSY